MKRKPADQASLNLQMPEGVHIGIPDEAYFNASAIGSTDLKTLYWQPESWWYASHLNLRRRQKLKSARKAALDLGTALHDLVLLGEDAYKARFTFEPDADDPRWIMTPVQLKKILRDQGVNVAGVLGKNLDALARKHGLAPRVWWMAWASFESVKRAGKPYLTEDEDMRIRHTARLVLNDPEVGQVFRDPAGMSEVAVFWRRPEDPDTLLRAKFDRIALQRMFDLKSLGNWRGRDIDGAVADAIETQDYGIQRRFYDEAFRKLIEFVAEGRIHGWTDDGQTTFKPGKEARATLEAIAAGGPATWVWVFVQLRNDNYGQERAPMCVVRWHRPEGVIWNEAGEKIETALANYRRLRSAFGLGNPWTLIDQAKELKDSDIRSRKKRELI